MFLTSWKEIAGYLGKGVRTVQRWERDLGLPVRHPRNGKQHVVIALPDDLDRWMRAQTMRASSDAEINRLREMVELLEAENENLKQQIGVAGDDGKSRDLVG